LTNETIEQAITLYSPLLVEFVTSFCKHCEKLDPEVFHAAKELQLSQAKIAQVFEGIALSFHYFHNSCQFYMVD